MTELEVGLLTIIGQLVEKVILAVLNSSNLTIDMKKDALAKVKSQLDATAAKVAAVKFE